MFIFTAKKIILGENEETFLPPGQLLQFIQVILCHIYILPGEKFAFLFPKFPLFNLPGPAYVTLWKYMGYIYVIDVKS